MPFINKYDIFYGFRREHSTNHAIITLVDRLTKALEFAKMVMGMFLDPLKSFDTVNHSILLHKLYQYVIRGNSLKLFESYFTNRSLYVYYNNTDSDIRPKVQSLVLFHSYFMLMILTKFLISCSPYYLPMILFYRI